jgi:membrane protein implicated in regulation of membrane protease activity
MAWWFWIVLGAVLLAAEVIISADFYLVFFGLAGLIVGLLAVFGVALPVWSQWLLFAGLAIAGLVIYRGRWKRKLMTTDRKVLPELEGEIGVAREDIAPGARGRIDLRGAAWDAQNEGPGQVAVGGRCVVLRVEGLTLRVRPEN